MGFEDQQLDREVELTLSESMVDAIENRYRVENKEVIYALLDHFTTVRSTSALKLNIRVKGRSPRTAYLLRVPLVFQSGDTVPRNSDQTFY